MRRGVVALLIVCVIVTWHRSAQADTSIIAPPPDPGEHSIGVGVEGPGAGGWGTVPRPRPTARPERQGPPPPDPCAITSYVPVPCSVQWIRDEGGAPVPPGAGPPVAAVLALQAREQVTVRVPRLHTSPDGVPQLAGKRTWYWMDPEEWRPVTVRAEIPGVWSEVTATPTRTVWHPGDGGPTVACAGPGRPHPGTGGATTTCGHVYTTVGAYTLRAAVTYEVTWRSSTGEAGTQDPFVLTAALPLTVEERQVVVS